MSASEMRRQSVRPVECPMILISQVQRSGGTLLSQLFDGHPECFVHPKELTWGRPTKADWPTIENVAANAQTLFSEVDESWIHHECQRGRYVKSESTNLAPESYPFVFDRELQSAIFRDVLNASASQTRRGILNAYLTSFFNAWLDYQSLYETPKKYTVAFCPRVLMATGSYKRFRQDYPNGYVVSSVRRPESWFASAEKHGYLDRYGSIDDVLQVWSDSTDATYRAFKANPDHVIVVAFEDLVTRPADTMALIARRIGVTYDPILETPTFNGIPAQSNSHFAPTHGVDASVAQRFASQVDPKVIDRVRAKTDEQYMAQCGEMLVGQCGLT